MMPNLCCVLLGCGEITLSMLDRLLEKPWFDVVGLVDVNPVAMDRVCQRLKGKPVGKFIRLSDALTVTNAEVVIINTPAEYHADQIQIGLQAGKHILVAKPFSQSYNTAEALVNMADDRGVNLSVAEQMRFMRHFRAVKMFLDSGELGRVEMVNFLNSKPRHTVGNLKEMRQPAVLEMSSHHFDLFAALFPERVPEWIMIDGFSPSWSVYAGPCMLNGSIRFTQGLHLLYHAGYSSQANCYELRLEGSRGALRCRGKHMSVPEMQYEFARRGGDFQSVDLEQNVSEEDSWSQFFDIWYSGLITHSEIPFSGRNNLKVVALMNAAIESIETELPCAIMSHPRYRMAFQSGIEWRVKL